MKGAVRVPDSVHMTRSLRCPHTAVTVPIIDFKDETVEFKSSSFMTLETETLPQDIRSDLLW